jgi:hypothetical protein
MVDVQARAKFARLIRHLVAGLITNDEFEDRLPFSEDSAVHEVYFNGVWGLYSDLYKYRLVGKNRVPREARRIIARYILFLKSDLEYEWPKQSRWQFPVSFVAALLTLGMSNRWHFKKFSKAGDIKVWPFIRQSDFEAALRRPPYLHGRN